jgi:hypothetical protein
LRHIADANSAIRPDVRVRLLLAMFLAVKLRDGRSTLDSGVAFGLTSPNLILTRRER